MSLSQRLGQVSGTRPLYGPPCSVSRLLENLPEDDRIAVENILAQQADGQGVSNRKLHEILIGEGHVVSYHSIGSHRRKQCRCFTGMDKQG
jgi:hypothetical protein